MQKVTVAGHSFISKLENRWQKNNLICVGLDSDYSQLPRSIKQGRPKTSAIVRFNKAIIDTTHDHVCAYKMQVAFYEAEGANGWKALEKTVAYIRIHYPSIPLILDAKRGDIDNTNLAYTKAIFDHLAFDAVTINPYMGKEALQPFLTRADKGILILVKTSNPGGGEFQDLVVQKYHKPLYMVIAESVAHKWNINGNCGVVVGATYPQELARVRKIIGNLPILIPGIGPQGGELEQTIKAGKTNRGWGMIINSSRGIIFASKGNDFAQAARHAVQSLEDRIRAAV